MTYQNKTLTDTNRDGVWDILVTSDGQENYFGDVTYEVTTTDNGLDGLIEKTVLVNNMFDSLNRLSQEYRGEDNNGDGLYEIDSWRVLDYNTAGQLAVESYYSEDANFNNLPDYSSQATLHYNTSGQIASKETFFYYDNTLVESDYRLESFTYNAKGQLAELTIEDWALYDFEIGYQYSYNTWGQLTKVTYKDPFVFGDENYHVEEKYFYNKNGTLKESNKYAEFFTHFDSEVPGQYVLEIKTKFSYDTAGRVKSELKTGQDNSWHTVEKELIENTYDANGRLASKTYSVDEDLNGVWDAAKTLEKFSYAQDGTLIMHSVDYATGDGHLEYLFTHTDPELLLG